MVRIGLGRDDQLAHRPHRPPGEVGNRQAHQRRDARQLAPVLHRIVVPKKNPFPHPTPPAILDAPSPPHGV